MSSRVALFHYNADEDVVEFRHYAVNRSTKGTRIWEHDFTKREEEEEEPLLDDAISKIRHEIHSIDLNYQNDSPGHKLEFENLSTTKPNMALYSETLEVALPRSVQPAEKKRHVDNIMSVNLQEIGPRITLQLRQIVSRYNDGEGNQSDLSSSLNSF